MSKVYVMFRPNDPIEVDSIWDESNVRSLARHVGWHTITEDRVVYNPDGDYYTVSFYGGRANVWDAAQWYHKYIREDMEFDYANQPV